MLVGDVANRTAIIIDDLADSATTVTVSLSYSVVKMHSTTRFTLRGFKLYQIVRTLLHLLHYPCTQSFCLSDPLTLGLHSGLLNC